MRSYLVILVTSIFLAGVVQAQNIPRDARIAIIGAGAAGLTAAYTLEKHGYQGVTVFEKEDRVGGKVYSYPLDGRIYEVGAFWAGDGYDVVDDLAKKFGVRFQSEEIEFLVRMENGQHVRMGDYPLKRFNPWQLTRGLYHWLKVQNKFKELYEVGGFFRVNHPDLHLPFASFVKKYQIEVFAQIYRPFWIGCGYGYYEETPAMYVLKLMGSSLNINLRDVLSYFLPWKGQKNSSLRLAPSGFQELWTRLAASLGDVRLNSEVLAVRRSHDQTRGSIEIITSSGHEIYDYLIVATDLKHALRYLDANTEEAALFSKVQNYRYILHLVEADIPMADGTMLFLDQYGKASTIGHVTALVNRQHSPHIWTTGQLLAKEQSQQDLRSFLNQDIEDLGGELYQIVEEIPWNYFPHVNTEALNAGFYPRLQQLQGKQKTFYVGGILNFETVEYTAAFAKNLVEKYFVK